jgi:DNA-binding NtrC family response regulator
MDKILWHDLDSLDLMSEQQPQLLVERFTVLQPQSTDPTDLKINCFYAKALVSLTRFSEAEELAQQILQSAVLADESFALVWGNIILSKVYHSYKDPHKIKPCLELAEDFALKSGSLDLIIEAKSHFVMLYANQGNFKAALDYLKRVEILTKKSKPGLTAINALLRCADVYHKLQDHGKVVALLKRALDLAQEADIIPVQLSIINNLSSTYSQLKRYKESEKLLSRGYAVAVQHKLKQYQLRIMFNLGVQNNLQSKFTEAIDCYDQVQALALEIGMRKPQFWLDLYCNFASCYWLSADVQNSMVYLEKAEKLLENIDSSPKKMWIAVNKTNILIAQEKYQEAKTILQSAISFYTKAKDLPNLLIVYRNLALLYQKNNQLERSIKTYQTIDETHIKHMEQILITKSEGYQVHYQELQEKIAETSSDTHDAIYATQSQKHLSFIGASEAIKKVLRTALLASQHPDANVLITGESGTGKEVIARYIHQNSIRKNSPFVPVNCSAISPNLLESEMFGHLKGSFTGALETTKGFFIAANQGTLFLDEITEMSVDMQPKLLRAMESRAVTPVGGNREIPFDCRIISASNRPIVSFLHDNTLRLDIFHRLNTIQIHIPPLRERPEDLIPLLNHFIDQYCRINRMAAPRVPRSFVEKLSGYGFPGNVRELKNIVNRLFILYPNQEWEPDLLQNTDIIRYELQPRTKRLDLSQEEERQLIITALLQCQGLQKEAAHQLGLTESTLSRRIQKYNLQGYTKRA